MTKKNEPLYALFVRPNLAPGAFAPMLRRAISSTFAARVTLFVGAVRTLLLDPGFDQELDDAQARRRARDKDAVDPVYEAPLVTMLALMDVLAQRRAPRALLYAARDMSWSKGQEELIDQFEMSRLVCAVDVEIALNPAARWHWKGAWIRSMREFAPLPPAMCAWAPRAECVGRTYLDDYEIPPGHVVVCGRNGLPSERPDAPKEPTAEASSDNALRSDPPPDEEIARHFNMIAPRDPAAPPAPAAAQPEKTVDERGRGMVVTREPAAPPASPPANDKTPPKTATFFLPTEERSFAYDLDKVCADIAQIEGHGVQVLGSPLGGRLSLFHRAMARAVCHATTSQSSLTVWNYALACHEMREWVEEALADFYKDYKVKE